MKLLIIILALCLIIPAAIADEFTEPEPTSLIETIIDYFKEPAPVAQYRVSRSSIIQIADINMEIIDTRLADKTPHQVLDLLQPGESRKIIDGEITWIIRKGL